MPISCYDHSSWTKMKIKLICFQLLEFRTPLVLKYFKKIITHYTRHNRFAMTYFGCLTQVYLEEHTSSASFFKELVRYASKSNFSSTISFMDFISFISFNAIDSISCICRCENAIALSEQRLIEVHPVLRWGRERERRGPSRLPFGGELRFSRLPFGRELRFPIFNLLAICLGPIKTLALISCGDPSDSLVVLASARDDLLESSCSAKLRFSLHSGQEKTSQLESKTVEDI